MMAPAAALSRSLRSLPLAALGDSPAVRRDAPPKSRREGAAVAARLTPPLRGRADGSVTPWSGGTQTRELGRTVDYVDDVQDAVDILVRAGVDEPRSLTSLTRESRVDLMRPMPRP
jgi:hypothetical protein